VCVLVDRKKKSAFHFDFCNTLDTAKKSFAQAAIPMTALLLFLLHYFLSFIFKIPVHNQFNICHPGRMMNNTSTPLV
jgi:hypothetical protein